MNEAPILDPRPLQDLLDLGAAGDLVQELIGLFQEDVPPRIGALQAAFEGGDLARMAAEAHQLKGALGNLGLARFAGVAAHLEAWARDSQSAGAGVGDLVASLPGHYEAAAEALRSAFPQS